MKTFDLWFDLVELDLMITIQCCLYLDGKYHVVPSGDLHVLRADLSDGSSPYVCRVKNILTGLEETSPASQFNVQGGNKFIISPILKRNNFKCLFPTSIFEIYCKL